MDAPPVNSQQSQALQATYEITPTYQGASGTQNLTPIGLSDTNHTTAGTTRLASGSFVTLDSTETTAKKGEVSVGPQAPAQY